MVLCLDCATSDYFICLDRSDVFKLDSYTPASSGWSLDEQYFIYSSLASNCPTTDKNISKATMPIKNKNPNPTPLSNPLISAIFSFSSPTKHLENVNKFIAKSPTSEKNMAPLIIRVIKETLIQKHAISIYFLKLYLSVIQLVIINTNNITNNGMV